MHPLHRLPNNLANESYEFNTKIIKYKKLMEKADRLC